MSARIFRYEVPVDSRVHEFLLTGDPLAVGCRQAGVMEFWAFHDEDAHRTTPRPRGFLVVGTGHPLPDATPRHWGTATDMGGALVWHLMELS